MFLNIIKRLTKEINVLNDIRIKQGKKYKRSFSILSHKELKVK
jgi:hypothetical protein